jgi:hypothetical protein
MRLVMNSKVRLQAGPTPSPHPLPPPPTPPPSYFPPGSLSLLAFKWQNLPELCIFVIPPPPPPRSLAGWLWLRGAGGGGGGGERGELPDVQYRNYRYSYNIGKQFCSKVMSLAEFVLRSLPLWKLSTSCPPSLPR